MNIKKSKTYDDLCAWCGRKLKVKVLSWQKVKSYHSMPLVANYCNEKTTGEEGEYNCEDIALSSDENIEKVTREIVRRRKSLDNTNK